MVDDDGVRVSAVYSCENGFQLVGATELECNLDTDEWQGELPACKQGRLFSIQNKHKNFYKLIFG